VARFLEQLGATLLLLGPAGLFLAALLDSSFLSLVEVTDILVVQWAIRDPSRVWMAILALSLGSLAGSSMLFHLGRKGGEGLLERRFGGTRAVDAREAFQRWNVAAVAVPAMLPPPAPFKLFVLAAGVFGCRYRTFALTVFLSRALRYSVWAVLAVVYGRDAVRFLGWLGEVCQGHPAVFLGVLALLAVGPIGFLWWKSTLGPGADGEAEHHPSGGAD
jgi:membrane protein YqaA with SNARE-associated domain